MLTRFNTINNLTSFVRTYQLNLDANLNSMFYNNTLIAKHA
ncbi:hypothetical protein P20439_1802 [Pseudoalteromonas sp. BSi20439]|nr:hypothetical protein P20439_1802 [Pseudoalteromonas sp. BSi20439]